MPLSLKVVFRRQRFSLAAFLCYDAGMQDTAEKVASMLAGLESAGLTRSQIARGAQLSRQTVYRLINGEYSAPSYETITKLQRLESRVCIAAR